MKFEINGQDQFKCIEITHAKEIILKNKFHYIKKQVSLKQTNYLLVMEYITVITENINTTTALAKRDFFQRNIMSNFGAECTFSVRKFVVKSIPRNFIWDQLNIGYIFPCRHDSDLVFLL